jgi:hypothetical protein
VVHTVDHSVQEGDGEDTLAFDKRKIGLPLPTQTDCYAGLIAADSFANRRIFDQETEYHEVEMGIVGSAR